jgi:preprotein translocase subunit SecB
MSMDLTVMITYKEGEEECFLLEEQEGGTWQILDIKSKPHGKFDTLDECMKAFIKTVNEKRYS